MVAVYEIVETGGFGIPEGRLEGGGRFLFSTRARFGEGAIVEDFSESRCEGQRVNPKGIDLDRLNRSRGNDPISDLRVHPRQLDAWLARGEQSIVIRLDAVTGSLAGGFDNFPDDVPDVRSRALLVPSVGEISVYGVNEPERCIDAVVVWDLSVVGEPIRDHALAAGSREGGQDFLRFRESSGDEGQTGKGDRGVPAPVPKPGVAR
ncbi:MAG: hypothetical protein CME26_01595 [Gemmatimonadetes bacterium]|nr:hypothetical protein [Gemmatimonadota bacterium]